jgi:hypothetical protein
MIVSQSDHTLEVTLADLQKKKEEILDLNKTKRGIRNVLMDALEREGKSHLVLGEYRLKIEKRPMTYVNLSELRSHPQIDAKTYNIISKIASKNVSRSLSVKKIRTKQEKKT